MCDPITIAGAVLTAGSAAANMAAQSKVAEARKNVLAAERIRQQGFDQQAEALNVGARNRYEDFSGQEDKTATKLGDMFKGAKGSDVAAAAPAAAQEQSIMPASSSGITVQNEQKARAGATAFTDQQGEALGNLRAFGDLLGGIGRDQARDAGYIGQIGNFKKGSSNVTGLELEEANNAGSGMGMLGDILGGLGKMGISAGLGGGSLAGLGGNGFSSVQNSILNDPLGVKSSLSTFARAGAGMGANMPLQLGVGAGSLPSFARGGFNPFNPYGS